MQGKDTHREIQHQYKREIQNKMRITKNKYKHQSHYAMRIRWAAEAELTYRVRAKYLYEYLKQLLHCHLLAVFILGVKFCAGGQRTSAAVELETTENEFLELTVAFKTSILFYG